MQKKVSKYLLNIPTILSPDMSREEADKILFEKGLIEFSIRTKSSPLDGVCSANQYIENATEKGYRTLVVTDHGNVQSFPEFYSGNNKINIVYGCEFEVVDEVFPEFFFKTNGEKIEDSIYEKEFKLLNILIIDFETSGLYPIKNQIVEVGYLVVEKGKIIEKKSFFIEITEKDLQERFLSITNIDKNELLNNGIPIEEFIIQFKDLLNRHKIDLLVSHNALKFDSLFLNKAWNDLFNQDFPYPFLDTLPLSWVSFPRRKTYRLEKLSQSKTKQAHRALDDSLLLFQVFDRIVEFFLEKEIKNIREIINFIKECKEIKSRERGYKLIVLSKNNEGLKDLYDLVTLSHTNDILSSNIPRILRKEIEKRRKNLLIGASGGLEGEIFNSFISQENIKNIIRKLKQYDYIEIRNPETFSHISLEDEELKQIIKRITFSIIKLAKKAEIKTVFTNNVHYCDRKQKNVKEILIANEGMNGSKHYLYSFLMNSSKKDKFFYVPDQHLRTSEETLNSWSFINNWKIVIENLVNNPEYIIEKISENKILKDGVEYKTFRDQEKELKSFCANKIEEKFKNKIPNFVLKRLNDEWNIIKKKYLMIYWIAFKLTRKAREDKQIVGSRGSVGCSFIAYLCGITDINPLPVYKICSQCNYCEEEKKGNGKSCYDFIEKEKCPVCANDLTFEGHSLPFETFLGLEGEKSPDIDLNVSGEYQLKTHDYVRKLLGESRVYRIGTVSGLSEKTSEIFWEEHKKFRKSLVDAFDVNKWGEEWKEEDKIRELEKEFKENDKIKKFSIQWYKKILDEKKELLIRDRLISELKGIRRTTGQHPGGLLVIPEFTNIMDFTPLQYPADNRSNNLVTHFGYDHLVRSLLKIDILGHDEPTVLKRLYSVDKNMNYLEENHKIFTDEKIIDIFNNSDTLGIPEFGTDSVRKNLLGLIVKQTGKLKFGDLVKICGFAHGENVWIGNQIDAFRKKMLSLEEMIGCREDIINLLTSSGIEKKLSFYVTDLVKKKKMYKLTKEEEKYIKDKLGENNKGDLIFDILRNISYIFPKPHAIAYTMTAMKTAYFKVYHQEHFYSVLLTYHSSVYDIWLMSLKVPLILSRINNLMEEINEKKNNRKELLSILRVLNRISKYNDNIKQLVKRILDYQSTDSSVEKYENEDIFAKIKSNFSLEEIKSWVLNMKDKKLLFTLRIISEMKDKGIDYRIGLDLNYSEIKEFKVYNGKLLVPFIAINGVGEKFAERIIEFRKGKELTGLESLKDITNKRVIEIFNKLKENNLLF